MKKQTIVNLIKYHSEKNEAGFHQEAINIANEFDIKGEHELSQYILSLISDNDVFVPQCLHGELQYCVKMNTDSEILQLPTSIHNDISGIINAVGRNRVFINKFLFIGEPGTGKTETVKQISRILNRDLLSVDFNSLIDSRMGQTSKNIADMFEEINNYFQPQRIVVLLDEIDSIAMDRLKSNDIREMGRATSAFIKGLDNLNKNIILFATTNLFSSFDKALVRRFDLTVNFNRYSQDDLAEIAEQILDYYLSSFGIKEKNRRLFRKILSKYRIIPYPGELNSTIKTSIAFSDQNKKCDYLRMLYRFICDKEPKMDELLADGFSYREIEILTGIPISRISRSRKLVLEEIDE